MAANALFTHRIVLCAVVLLVFNAVLLLLSEYVSAAASGSVSVSGLPSSSFASDSDSASDSHSKATVDSSWSFPFLDLPPVTSLSWHWSDLVRVPSLWWRHYLGLWQREPQHVLIELLCIVAIVYLILRSPEDSKKQEKLSKQEEDELIRSWEPQPLAPPIAKQVQPKRKHVLQGVCGEHVLLGGQEYLNWASFNFLGYAGNRRVEDECRRTIDKYGVGSCGPRGFYGTFDVHLEIEERLAKLFGADGCILYSDGIACLASVIPAFAKRGDLLVVDERVNYGIQQGVQLSRSNVLYYKHNDLDDLKRVLDSVVESDLRKGITAVTNRRFIVTEGVFHNSGEILPLDKVIELKKRYKYRLILDDSIGFGVLGNSGKGVVEHFNAKITDVDMYCGTLDLAMATVGGFCVADHHIVSHQRLSGAGYCFSASSPPYAVMAGIVSLDMLANDSQPSEQCRENAKRMRAAIANLRIPQLQMLGGSNIASPVIHLRPNLNANTVAQAHRSTNGNSLTSAASTLAAMTSMSSPSSSSSSTSITSSSSLSAQRDLEQQFVESVSESLYANGVMVDVPAYIPSERTAPPPSIRILVCSHHTQEDIQRTVQIIADAWKAAL